MKPLNIALLALAVGLAVVLLPWLIPTGPSADFGVGQLLHGGRLLTAALVVFGGGLFTALTPCVYPLIPITVSVFGARKGVSRGRALLLTTSYVVGMGLVFSALGVLAAKTGQAFGSALGNPWVVAGLAAFLLVLASSMFGAFELELPQGMTQRLSTVGGAGVAGALLMGGASGFLAAPCTGPVLTGLLAFVAQTQSTLAGGSLLFVYALGIGVPFFLIGAFAMKLPKGGVWMEWVKSVLGIALVALAASYIRDVSPALRGPMAEVAGQLGRVPGAWIAGGIAAIGILLGAVHRSFKAPPVEVALKGSGVAVVVVAVLLRMGALNEPTQGALWARLSGVASPAPRGMVWNLRFPQTGGASTVGHFEQYLERARAEGKPVLIDFYADWCTACKELDRETYTASKVVEESGRFLTIKVDGTNEEEDGPILDLYERFGVQGLPTVAFITSKGEILQDPRVTGFLAPEKFLDLMAKVR